MTEEKNIAASWRSFVPSQKANYVLCSLSLGFLASLYIKITHPSFIAEGVYYVLEASLVGGIADYFAVEALFRKPFGISYHTALIPHYRDKLTAGCGDMVAKEFLTRRKLLAERNNYSLVDEALHYLDMDNNRNKVKGLLLDAAENYLQNLDILALATELETLVKRELLGVDFYGKLDEFLANYLKVEKNNLIFDYLIDKCDAYAHTPAVYNYIRQKIDEKVAEEESSFLGKMKIMMARATGILNEEELAAKLYDEALVTVGGLRNNDYLRSWFVEKVRKSLTVFHESPDWHATILKLQTDLINNVELKFVLERLIASTIKTATRPEGNSMEIARPTILAQIINSACDSLETELRSSAELRRNLENYLKHLSGLALLTAQSMLSPIISKIMDKLTDDDLNKLIQSKVDEDLTFIRLNGSIVGGTIGLLIYIIKICC
ncbi:MAG: DUF445 domain-containing protein [Phascolarctobacterium sp.]|nr:DUF445 domain-containing protein [Phascolarctobacterium sp.]